MGIDNYRKRPSGRANVGKLRETAAAAVSGYEYGYPTGATQPSDGATMQFLFDEASGNITSEVGTLTLTEWGTPVNSVDTTSYSALMPTGINMNNASYYYATGLTNPPGEVGTGDYTVEWVYKGTSTDTADEVVQYHYEQPGNLQRHYIFMDPGDNRMVVAFTNSAGGAIRYFNSISNCGFNDSFRKYRLVFDRDGGATALEIFLDGVSQGTQAAPINATACICHDMYIGANNGGSGRQRSPITELRTTNNIAANSGGPGGG